ncbi:MAG: serine/threonine protein kinase, partial [Anaerolineales bacterium]|nr:serine/threonine protein kinase [Anaerolineales bacterium]
MPILPGEILNKRYRIVSLMAEGAYGAVYHAWDMTAGREVAVKEYLDASIEIQKRFRQEARRLSDLSHPQLPDVLDHFALEGVGQYLVSEYVPGVDLQSVLERYGKLPSDLIVSWLQAICVPLSYLHKRGVLHLNLKPVNMRLTPTGEMFLVNVGLPGLGVRPRSSGYGSPEQQAQLDVGAAADIYSLGATLYVMLTGQIPPNALGRESGLSDLKPAREVDPDVEPYLSLVAGRAMTLRADARYESVADFARALERPFTHQPVELNDLRRNVERETAVAPPPQ